MTAKFNPDFQDSKIRKMMLVVACFIGKSRAGFYKGFRFKLRVDLLYLHTVYIYNANILKALLL